MIERSSAPQRPDAGAADRVRRSATHSFFDPASPRVAAVLLALLTLAMTWWTWGRWPDVLVDFGRELYVPWRLASGDVLYRDIAYFNGPLSAYANALLFALIGSSLRALALVNVALIGAVTALLYALLSRIGSRLS